MPEMSGKLTYIQIFYFSYQSTMSQFVHFIIISQILSCTLIFTTFFRGVSFKSISVSQSKMIDAVLLKFYNGRIGNYGQMTI